MRKLRALVAALVSAAALAAACDDDPPSRPPIAQPGDQPFVPGAGGGESPDGAAPDAGEVDAGDGATACTDLSITGSEIPQQVLTGEPPAGTGGTIVDGIYDVTDATLYNSNAVPGPSGASYQGSIRITGTTFERHLLFRTAGGALVETTNRGTIDTAAAAPVILLSCPFPAQEPITYTVAGNNLIITNLTTKETLGFTRRP